MKRIKNSEKPGKFNRHNEMRVLELPEGTENLNLDEIEKQMNLRKKNRVQEIHEPKEDQKSSEENKISQKTKSTQINKENHKKE